MDPLLDLPASEYTLFRIVAAFALGRLAGAVTVEEKLTTAPV